MFQFTTHIKRKAMEMGIPLSTVENVLRKPDRIAPCQIHPGQKRYIGQSIAVMVDPVTNCAITMYLDKVRTPLRDDQIKAGVQICRNGNSFSSNT